LGNAERFVDQHADKFRYEPTWEKALVWDGRRWEMSDDTAGLRLAMETARSIYLEAAAADDHAIRAALSKHAVASESRSRLQSMVALAQAKLTTSHKELDQHPYLFNCANGVLDLRTGELLAHDPGLYLTQVSTVEFDPTADCPTWEEFINAIFEGDADLIRWVQRWLGYSLSGLTVEQVLVIFHGSGANGKSTLLNAVQDVMGDDYAGKAPPTLLMATKQEQHPTGMATLFGRRFVAAVETEQGRRLAESVVKELTGGDRITARRMREDFWEFSPTHKLVLCTNHKPVIVGNDHAIWRRIKLVPFTVKIPLEQQDKHLAEKLHAERSGILNWLLTGWREYQENGLGSCKVIDEATAEYKAAEDVFSEFIAEHCTLNKGLDTKASAIVSRYTAWARENGHEEMNGKAISEYLTTTLGLKKKRNNGIVYYGIGLKAEENDCYPDY
jgi:putative DNA primase/helicase